VTPGRDAAAGRFDDGPDDDDRDEDMKIILIGLASLALAAPALADDEDELEVTMQVLDDVGDLEDDFTRGRRPVPAEPVDEEAAAAEALAAAEAEFAGIRDDFEHDDVDDDIDEDLDDEDDFGEHEEVDLNVYDDAGM